MKILTAAEMGAADRRSVEAGVSVSVLMENAGAAVARFCLRRFGGAGLVVVLCGKGNNGGDGLVAARYMAEGGRNVRVLLLGAANELKGEPVKAFAAAVITAMGLHAAGSEAGYSGGRMEVREVWDEEQLQAGMQGAGLVVDAIVGTGFTPPLRGLAATAGGLIGKMVAPVVAVDVPSGWDADAVTPTVEGAFRADAVVTFAAPKLAHVFGQMTGDRVFGPVVVAGIGTPKSAVVSGTGLHWAGTAKSVTETPRAINSNKGTFGHVLLMGGALGKAGAPSMASLAAMRAGAGLVTAAVPQEVLATVAAVAPELMLTPLQEQGVGSREQGVGNELGGIALDHLSEKQLPELLKGISVVAIGPGLGQVGTTPEFVRRFVEQVTLSMVIDADALNAFAGRADALKEAAKEKTVVLTPHPGEMARLVGMTVKEVEADRVGLARRFATEYGVTLVLKGWRTLIAHPDGRVGVNTTGNPAMAKGGSGDVLTGIVAAMLAQYARSGKAEDVAQAVEAAVFLHGLAGDFAAVKQDEHTVLATDTVGHLCDAFRSRVRDEDGLTWVVGAAAR
ncbi:NAD(P)H-hydrate dehydratase [Granulicella sp. 5B5]|uniref:NAD(P)H-hydrate dehydratase n=1 Tax=Granulicella sp. 5B5 TaxID=1617967 RepID=UPI0015F72BA5|nr:NAD(P)H-hydrate dehydratase [Granulicella sp. 5B5]QMV18113.1 NAD(P)H-hydrate dehydratase [Granulicella sp. 5B5]